MQTWHILNDGGYRVQPAVLLRQYGKTEPHSSPFFLIMCCSSQILRSNSIRRGSEKMLGGQEIGKPSESTLSANLCQLRAYRISWHQTPIYSHGKRPLTGRELSSLQRVHVTAVNLFSTRPFGTSSRGHFILQEWPFR